MKQDLEALLSAIEQLLGDAQTLGDNDDFDPSDMIISAFVYDQLSSAHAKFCLPPNSGGVYF